jgi:hypothetical protein
VRWVVITAVVLVAAWVTLQRLSRPEANGEAALNRPVARLQEVRSISLEGKKLPLARLRGVLTTRAGEPLDRAHLDRDRDAMERELGDLGYLAARVEPAVVSFDAAGAAYVTFEVDPGKLFHLRNVEITGTGRDVVVVTLAAGDDAIRDRIEQARLAMADVLARRGKAPAVELSVHTDLAAAAVDVVFATR